MKPPPPKSRKTPGIQDVAAASGMHKSTVSQALSGKGKVSSKTRERLTALAIEIGYQPNPLAQRLASSATNDQVILCSRTLDIKLTTEKLLLIQRELASRGLEVPIYSLSSDGEGREEHQATQIRQLCRQQPRAIVCSAQAIHESAFPELDRYQRKGGVVVSYDVEIPLDCDKVVFDREDNGYRAAQALIEAGHREIGLALSTSRYENGQLFFCQDARIRGFARALNEAGLTPRPEWVFEGGTHEEGGADLASRFLALPKRPTGLCIVNEYMALGFMVEVLRAGMKIPHDISIVGHDNQAVAAYCPVPLTCVNHPKDEIARAVCQLLLARLSGSQQPMQTTTIRGELVQRRSIAS